MPLRSHMHSSHHTQNRPVPTHMAGTAIPFGAQPFIGETMTQVHTVTGPAIVETHVNQSVIHEHHHEQHVVHERHIDQPIVHERHIDQPVIHERHIDQPVIHERHMEQPVIHERHIDQPVIHERHIDKPIIHERHIEQPIIHEKHYEQPIIHEQHIVKTVEHEVHINKPIIHENVVLPARVEIATHTGETITDSQYTSAAPIVMSERTLAPEMRTVEYSTNAPIMHSNYNVSPSATMTSAVSMAPTAVTATVLPFPALVQPPMVVPGQGPIVVTEEKHRHHRLTDHLHRHRH